MHWKAKPCNNYAYHQPLGLNAQTPDDPQMICCLTDTTCLYTDICIRADCLQINAYNGLPMILLLVIFVWCQTSLRIYFNTWSL